MFFFDVERTVKVVGVEMAKFCVGVCTCVSFLRCGIPPSFNTKHQTSSLPSPTRKQKEKRQSRDELRRGRPPRSQTDDKPPALGSTSLHPVPFRRSRSSPLAAAQAGLVTLSVLVRVQKSGFEVIGEGEGGGGEWEMMMKPGGPCGLPDSLGLG